MYRNHSIKQWWAKAGVIWIIMRFCISQYSHVFLQVDNVCAGKMVLICDGVWGRGLQEAGQLGLHDQPLPPGQEHYQLLFNKDCVVVKMIQNKNTQREPTTGGLLHFLTNIEWLNLFQTLWNKGGWGGSPAEWIGAEQKMSCWSPRI